MDLSQYIRKGYNKNKYDIKSQERHCRQCSKVLEDKEHYLYGRGFCSEECNRKYIEGV